MAKIRLRERTKPRASERGKRRVGGIPFHRRHRRGIVAALVAIIVVPILATAGYAYMLNNKLNSIDKVKTTLNEADRPDPDKGKALNVLLIGSDKGKPLPGQNPKTTVADDAKADQWPAGKYRSDTLMIVHITSDRKAAYLMSIPRDTFTMLYDAQGNAQHEEKINAAFSEYGPLGTLATVENLTNLRMKHLAIIDWAGFRDLSTAVGGVPVTIPRSFYDPSQKFQWEAGEHLLKGEEALKYVRTRYGLAGGDFDRIKRQQNFLRALMEKILAKGTMRSPTKLFKTVTALTENLTVDEEWTAGDMRGLALSLRGIASEDVTFLTAPVAGTETIPVYGSIVRLDPTKAEELYTAFREDDLAAYLEKYPDEVLGDKNDVS